MEVDRYRLGLGLREIEKPNKQIYRTTTRWKMDNSLRGLTIPRGMERRDKKENHR